MRIARPTSLLDLSARYSARIKTIKDAGWTDVNAHLSLATARIGVPELTLRCSQAGLRPAQISRPREFGGLADHSERVTRRMLRGDGMVAAGAHFALPISPVRTRRARIPSGGHRHHRS